MEPGLVARIGFAGGHSHCLPSAQAHFRYARALEKEKKFSAAIAEYQRTLGLDPGHSGARLNLAWILATCPDASLRNGPKAVEAAQRAVQLSAGSSPQILDTLAAAYAGAGRFPEAVGTARQAMELSVAQNNKALADVIQNQLKLFESRSPYHEKP